jgi:hypothetical protein
MPDSDLLDRLFDTLANADVPVPAPDRVVARGRQRRRRARGRSVIAVAAAVAVVVVGVMQLPRYLEPPATASQRTPPAVCAAAPDAALTAELSHALPVSQQQSVSVIGLSPNHAVLYLLTTAVGFHGIAAESVATGTITEKIPPAAIPLNAIAVGGLGPDGQVVFAIGTPVSPGGPLPAGSELWSNVIVWSPKPLPAWMATKDIGQAVPIGIANQDTETLSPPVFSGTSHQLVAWEAPGADYNSPTRKIVEANLRTGVTDVIATGYVGAPVFVGTDLVWPVADSATGPTHLVAVSASAFPARQRVSVPLPLRKAGAATVIASSGGATLYASPGLTKLFYSPSLSQPARQALQLQAGNYLAPGGLAVGPGYLAWNTSAGASYVASAKNLAAARITDGFATQGGVQGLGSDVLASRSAHPKTGPRSLYLLSGSVIGGLTCAKPNRALQ